MIVNKGLTVRELSRCCNEQILKGNGEKHVWISIDEEGNGFHRLFFSFVDEPSEVEQMLGETIDEQEKYEEIVILG